MPYFKNNDINLLFIHIPKTGGSSLENYFSFKYNIPLNYKSLHMFIDEETKIKNNIEINSSLQHITYQTIYKYKKELNIDFNNIKIITIVRNPYERIISDLFNLSLITINNSKEEVYNIIQKYLLYNNLDNHNIPQYLYITNDNKELIPNIIILHTETLISDMKNIGYDDFNYYDNINVIKLKKTMNLSIDKENINYYNYLNSDSIKLINEYYDYDFILFNYTKILS